MHDAISLAEALYADIDQREEQLVESCCGGVKDWETYQKHVGQIRELRRIRQTIQGLLNLQEEDNG